MELSVLKEVSSKTLGAWINKRVYDAMYWPDFFPLKTTPFLSYETLIGSTGARVAADVVAYNSRAPEKTRKVVSRIQGELQPIRMMKTMRESDLNQYNVMKAMGRTEINDLLALIFADSDACVDGVNGRLEWLVLQALTTGTVTLLSTNNVGITTETAIDFGMPAANKNVCTAAAGYWTTAAKATNDPVSDIETVVAEARVIGSRLAWINMNYSKWLAFRASAAIQSFMPTTAYAVHTPTLGAVNDALVAQGLPRIRIIDTTVTLENADHTQTTVDPWLDASGADRYVTFTPDGALGNMLVGPLATETNPPKQAALARRGHVLVYKYSEANPLAEHTVGECNAFPSWPTVDQCFIFDSESYTTFGA